MREVISEQDEFLLSRLLDGDLDAEEADALRRRLLQEPDLRRAYDAMSRLEDLLRGRQSMTGSVDFADFHRSVMARVASERATRPARLSIVRFLRVAVPLAAAAAIAVVVAVYRPASTGQQPGGSAPIAKYEEIPQATPESVTPVRPIQLAVQYNRPSATTDGTIRVSYARSNELAQAMKERDTERRSRPTFHMYVAQRTPQPASRDGLFDAPL